MLDPCSDRTVRLSKIHRGQTNIQSPKIDLMTDSGSLISIAWSFLYWKQHSETVISFGDVGDIVGQCWWQKRDLVKIILVRVLPVVSQSSFKKIDPSSWFSTTKGIDCEEITHAKANPTSSGPSPCLETFDFNRKYYFQSSLPVNSTLKISFPVWADITKRSEIQF